jgi:hypothetical protein
MKDFTILKEIQRLADEENRLRDGVALDSTEREQLDRIEMQLDQCWDFLRQRRALRHAGGDPDDAAPRDPKTVERYVQ